MKKILFVISILFLISIVSAQKIDVSIAEDLNVSISSLSYPEINNNIFKLTTELFNRGSIGYKVRERLDVFNQSKVLYTAWSREEPLVPGTRSVFNIYWYEPNKTGNFTGRLRVYYENEIKESEIEFEVKDLSITQDIFEISNFRTYDDYIKFSLKSPQTVKNVIAFVSDHPMGWIFEQAKIENLDQNDKISVYIPYQASLWTPSEIKVSIVTEDGKYYSSKSFTMVKEGGLIMYINYLIDAIKVLLNI